MDNSRWEYKTLSIDVRGYGLNKTLDDLGSLGWELVSTLPAYTHGVASILFFKRRVQ